MKAKSKITVFGFTNELKVLSFLAANPEKDFVAGEIHSVLNISRPGVYVALRGLANQGLVRRNFKGKMLIYSLDAQNPVSKQFKILAVTVMLSGLVNELKAVSRKIVLFGSASRGEDRSDSDIDLFVISKDTDSARGIIASFKTGRKIQAVIKTQAEFTEFKEQNKVFCNEIDRGITLWEGQERWRQIPVPADYGA